MSAFFKALCDEVGAEDEDDIAGIFETASELQSICMQKGAQKQQLEEALAIWAKARSARRKGIAKGATMLLARSAGTPPPPTPTAPVLPMQPTTRNYRKGKV